MNNLESKKQLSLPELYQSKLGEPTPAQSFIEELAQATNRKVITVRMWCLGKFKPEPIIRNIIAEKLNVDVKCLFPDD